MKTSEQTIQAHPIRIIHADDLQNSVTCFYETYAHKPVIGKGLLVIMFLQALNRGKAAFEVPPFYSTTGLLTAFLTALA